MQITEIVDRLMKTDGPALLFENVVRKQIPALINAFESTKGVAMALGICTDCLSVNLKLPLSIRLRPGLQNLQGGVEMLDCLLFSA